MIHLPCRVCISLLQAVTVHFVYSWHLLCCVIPISMLQNKQIMKEILQKSDNDLALSVHLKQTSKPLAPGLLFCFWNESLGLLKGLPQITQDFCFLRLHFPITLYAWATYSGKGDYQLPQSKEKIDVWHWFRYRGNPSPGVIWVYSTSPVYEWEHRGALGWDIHSSNHIL